MHIFDTVLRQAPEAPAGGAPPAPPPAAPPGGAPPAAPPGNDAPWFAGHPDEAVRTFLTEQNIGDPNVAATKLFHANKALAGAGDVIAKPAADATPEQKAAFYEALGRPKEAAAYDFGLPPEVQVDAGFQDWAKSTFHEIGMSGEQAKALVGKWQQFQTDYAANMAAEAKVAETAAIDGLKKEYGAGFDQFIADGQKAYSALGLDQATQNALAGAAGTAPYLALMAALGKKMGGEAGFKNATGGAGAELPAAQMTPEQATAEINRLMGDPAFQAKYNSATHPEHKVALQRMESLFARQAARAA